MLQLFLDLRLDYIAFAIIGITGTIATHLWLRGRGAGGLSIMAWMLLLLTLTTGAVVTEIAGDHERHRMQQMLTGVAPTYAAELSRLHHYQVTADSDPHDPTYLAIIDAEKRWLRANPLVNDIYTFRMTDDNRIVLIADSETDYNRDGKYDGEREERTDIGEPYDEASPNMVCALEGMAIFDAMPVTDRWGTWVSAYAPVRDAQGHVEAAVGVDYDAGYWLTSILWSRALMLGCVAVVAIVQISTSSVVAITHAEMAERQRLQQQLVDASREAGMAEIATGVLHNVGNVLNSVNVAASTVSEKLRKSKVPSLARAVDLLRQREQDLGTFLTVDEKGKQIPAFLTQLTEFLGTERQSMLDEMTLLSRSIDHIKEIVAAQQLYARAVAQDETFNLADVIEEALRLDFASLQRHNIAIERRMQTCPQITCERHKVMQIVVNLLSNAKKAIVSAETAPTPASSRIIIELDSMTHDGAATVRLRVIDNGVGIDAANLPQLFNHGFTTRDDGHGFGLHASANAARAMGGSLTASSDGPGLGAAFTLVLPVIRQSPPSADADSTPIAEVAV